MKCTSYVLKICNSKTVYIYIYDMTGTDNTYTTKVERMFRLDIFNVDDINGVNGLAGMDDVTGVNFTVT